MPVIFYRAVNEYFKVCVFIDSFTYILPVTYFGAMKESTDLEMQINYGNLNNSDVLIGWNVIDEYGNTVWVCAVSCTSTEVGISE